MRNTNNKDFSGSLHGYDVHPIIKQNFKDFFERHRISKSQNVYYKNENAELFIGASDHRYIELTFRKPGKEKWYKLEFYLEASFGLNSLSIWSELSDKYSYSNLDELAEAFIKLNAAIAEKYLNEPFENDYTWEEKYDALKSDSLLRAEVMKCYPEEKILYKMYFDRDVRDKWRLMAKEKLRLNK
jgi:hypothetical protein